MKRTLAELINYVNIVFGGENPSEDVITLIEDITDSMETQNESEEIKTLNLEIERLHQEIQNVESNWKQRYISRFTEIPNDSKTEDETEETEETEEIEETEETVNDLFKPR